MRKGFLLGYAHRTCVREPRTASEEILGSYEEVTGCSGLVHADSVSTGLPHSLESPPQPRNTAATSAWSYCSVLRGCGFL